MNPILSRRRALASLGIAGVGMAAAPAISTHAGPAVDPVLVLFQDWQKVHADVTAVSVKMSGIDDRTPEGKEQLEAAEAELDEFCDRRVHLAEAITRTQSFTAVGLLAKLAIASAYIREGYAGAFPGTTMDIEDAMTLSVHADAERLLAGG